MLPICPECRDGKHQNCDGIADISASGKDIGCACVEEVPHPRRPGYLQGNQDRAEA